MSDFSVRAGDRQPLLVATLKNEDGTPIDLTNATSAKLWMRRRDSIAMAIEDAAMAILTPKTDGRAQYAWVGGDTQVADIGGYWAVVRVVWNDDTPQTFPMPDLLTIDIVPDLANLPVISDEDLAYIRSRIGTAVPPSDVELATTLKRLGTPADVVLEVLEGRWATLVSQPTKLSLEGDMSIDTSENLKALKEQLVAARVATGAKPLVVGHLIRSDRPR